MHIFTDLRPYICTFDSCGIKSVRFPTRKLWLTHDDTHRFDSFWRCPICSQEFHQSIELTDHLKAYHSSALTMAQMIQVTRNSQHQRPHSVDDQICPFCNIVPGKSRRNYATHVGRHMETIALAVLVTNTKNKSDGASNHSASKCHGNIVSALLS